MFKGVRVLVTGHTGFKGGWLSLWLQQLGATVLGYSLPSPTEPSLFEVAGVAEGICHKIGDLRDFSCLLSFMQEQQPELVFHLAAQPLVLDAFEKPRDTFDVNVGGTVNLLEAVRCVPSVRAAVVVTTDKCYENCGWLWGYRENDRLGGNDPYSASKAMAELGAAAYRHLLGPSKQLATARAGNVIGGGDFAPCRLLPDALRAASSKEPLQLRQPTSVRPWLYILDVLSGYLALAKRLLAGESGYDEAWNFGPVESVGVTAKELVERAFARLGGGRYRESPPPQAREMPFLRLNWEKAAEKLKWEPRYSWKEAVDRTVDWDLAYRRGSNMRAYCLEEIERWGSGEVLSD